MQTLSRVPYTDIKVGDRVKSKNTGNEGFVSKKENKTRYSDDNFLYIRWDTGKKSNYEHYILDYVWLM